MLVMKSYLFGFSHALTLGYCLTLQYRILTLITSTCSIMVNVLITLFVILVVVLAISHGKKVAESDSWKETLFSEETYLNQTLCL